MRKLWLIRKDQEAVSPVIATILMVAITVVLAAVLYVMVSGLIGGGGTVAPTISFTAANVLTTGGGNDWEFRIANVDRTEGFGNYRVSVLETTTTILGPTDLGPGTPLLGSGISVFHLNVTDLDGGGKLSGGDTFVLGNTDSGKTYHVVFFWKSSGNEIARKTLTT